jgi:AcrR family transcriptional regulator
VPRESRASARRRTRDLLLDAAVRVFARRGYDAARLAGVAREAGLTTGAVYSNFEGKRDLFLAAFEREIARHLVELTEAVEGAGSPAERVAAAAEQWSSFLTRAPDRFPLFIEYWSHAVRDPDLRPQFAARFAALREATARLIAAEAEAAGVELQLPADRIAIAVNALTNGIALEHLADPEAVPADLYGTLLSLLLGAVEARAASPPSPTS